MGVNHNNKGKNGSNNKTNGIGRGRPYGMMYLLAFGAALLGVLILHKLRERRIFNLIVKQKDQHLFSLQLLFQKEKDYGQEVKRKNEEMRAKIYTLRNQKMELDRTVLEMRSTIDSLKEELKTIEASFEEKQNEIRTLKVEQDRLASEKENDPRVLSLIGSLKQKEAEIEELKQRLEYPGKVWSASSDDPSRSNVTAANVTTARQRGGGSENRIVIVGNGDEREMIGTQVDKFQRAQDQSDNDNANDETSSRSREKSVANSTTENSRHGSEDIAGEKINARANGKLEMQGKRRGEGEEDRGIAKAGMKLEIQDDRVRSLVKGRRGFVSNGKGKRWRLIAKNRRFESNGKNNGSLSRGMRFYNEGRAGPRAELRD